VRKLRSAIRETDRLATLVEGLLEVSRLATGRFRLHLEPLDLTALLRDALERAADAARAAGCALSLVATAPLYGRWDRSRLEQVLACLLGNAFRYAPGAPVEVHACAAEGRACIEVRDRGRGIAAADLERIFDRFERAVPAHRFGGLGLGLYMTRQIVEAHGGTVAVDSVEGEGSVFRVWLPVETDTRESVGAS
jgi:signal transduction histidine kinase